MNLFPPGYSQQGLNNQGGMALLLCLIFLTSLTLLGLSSSADTLLQNQLSANLQETERARQSASATLSWAEKWLLELEGTAPEVCTESCEGLIVHAAGTLPLNPEYEDLSWWSEYGHEAGVDPLTGELVAPIGTGDIQAPMWVIEKVHETPLSERDSDSHQVWYRILARGNGLTVTSISVIESVVTRNWVSIDNIESDASSAPGPCPGTEPTTKCGRLSWQELR